MSHIAEVVQSWYKGSKANKVAKGRGKIMLNEQAEK